MKTLFELATENNNLEFLDDNGVNVFCLKDIPRFIDPEESRGLVFLYLSNSIESLKVFWMLMNTKHCLVLLAPTLSDSLKIQLEERYQPAYIYDVNRSVINKFESLSHSNFTGFFKNEMVNIAVIDKNIKLLLSTSGTTGSPKFVKLSESNIIKNAQSIASYLPICNSDVTPLNLPIYYSYGLSILTSNALKGGKIVCSNTDLLNRNFWESFKHLGYTSLAGVPFVYEMLIRIGFQKMELPTLKYFTQAGGKLSNDLVEKFHAISIEKNAQFFVMYGQTEATARMSYLDPTQTKLKIGSIGKPIPGGKFEIDSESKELIYFGDNVFGGYANNKDDLRIYEVQECLRTGDLAEMDKDGYFYIIGRIKRISKVFGSRINLDELETILSNKYEKSFRCISIDDKLIVVFYDENQIDKSEVCAFVSNEFKLHISVLKTFHMVDFPLTANGKIDYNQLKKLYGAN